MGVEFRALDNYMRYDVIDYGDFCIGTEWTLAVGYVAAYIQLNVNECVFGIIGSILGYKNTCDWGTYYIQHPLWGLKLDKFG